MSYSDFTLDKVRKTFGLTISDKIDIFASVHEVECPPLLAEVLWENVPLALASNTEKSRSEMIIAPILIAVRKYLNNQISLFSGIDFSVDTAQGLEDVLKVKTSQKSCQSSDHDTNHRNIDKCLRGLG